MPTTILRTRDGLLDAADEASMQDLEQRLGASSRKVLLHLHGGLVAEEKAVLLAQRLGGSGDGSYRAHEDYEQIYVVWRTGLFETLGANWKDLASNDRLYRALVKKLIHFLARKLTATDGSGRSAGDAVGLTPAEIRRRLDSGQEAPFADVDRAMASGAAAGRAVSVPPATDFAREQEFETEVVQDLDFVQAVGDIDEALNAGAPGRGLVPVGADAAQGRACLARLDANVESSVAIPAGAAGPARGLLSGAGLFLKFARHGATIMTRVVRRFRDDRDHGLHATIAEELVRELYADRIGAAVWGMMKKDGADHFAQRGLGARLIGALAQRPDHSLIVVGHSAGSIWASEWLKAAAAIAPALRFQLVFLAPGVRVTHFAEAIDQGGALVSRFRMFAMSDELERADALLGKNFGFIYPSSLLYLVSGLFEDDAGRPHPDAPILGMQRFVGDGHPPAWLTDPTERAAHAKVVAFLAKHADSALYAKVNNGAGLRCESVSHGGFDEELHTLQSIGTLF